MKSVTMDVRDDEEEEEEDDEAGESAVQCDECGIPLDLLATIRDQGASLDDLQGADWRKTIKDSLVAAGWTSANVSVLPPSDAARMRAVLSSREAVEPAPARFAKRERNASGRASPA